MSDIKVGERVNKITSKIDGNRAVLVLYRTHKRLGILTNENLGIPDFPQSGAKDKMSYVQYCRDVAINLLENGGIKGFYYDNNSQATQSDKPQKFNSESLQNWSIRSVEERITSMDLSGTVSVLKVINAEIDATDRYKDGTIKYGESAVRVHLMGTNLEEIKIMVIVEVKSGQMCKPKAFRYNGSEFAFNPTNIRRLFTNITEGKPTPPKTTPKVDKPKPTPSVSTKAEDKLSDSTDPDQAINDLINSIRRD